ncbi:hypothetical protein BH20BAC1_BH20BAC1_02980 [soil metagenome]
MWRGTPINKLRSRQYVDKEGHQKYVTEVIARQLFLPYKR